MRNDHFPRLIACRGIAKPASARLGSGYLSREEPGVFLTTGAPGTIDRTGSNARFIQPAGIAFGIQKNIAGAWSQIHAVRMIDKKWKGQRLGRNRRSGIESR